MGRYSYEEKYVIDKEIENLDLSEKKYFYKYYKQKKNPYLLMALAVLLGFFLAPFFYLGWRLPDNVKYLGIINFAIYILHVIIAMFFLSSIAGLLMGLALVLNVVIYVYYSKDFQNSLDDFNYDEKVKILKNIIK